MCSTSKMPERMTNDYQRTKFATQWYVAYLPGRGRENLVKPTLPETLWYVLVHSL